MKERIYSFAASGLVVVVWMVFFSPYAPAIKSETKLADIVIETNSEENSKPILVFPIKGKSILDVISKYGESRGNGNRIHEGIDIPAPKGTPVLAVQDGTIEKIVNRGKGGKQIWLKSGDRTFFYAHLDDWQVTAGQKVKQGDIIANVGNTGNASKTRPHLHLGIYLGSRKTVNPDRFNWINP